MNEEEKQAVVDSTDHPQEFLCPITLDLMVEPVMLFDDGHTYEKHAISEWIKSNNTSPMTNEQLYIKKFKTNFALKSQIIRYKQHLQQQSSNTTAGGSTKPTTVEYKYMYGLSSSKPESNINNHLHVSNQHQKYFISYSNINIVKEEYYEISDISETESDDDILLSKVFDELSINSRQISQPPKPMTIQGMNMDDRNIIEINVQLVGDCNVGKTAFRKFIEFNDFRSNSSPTIGEEFSFVRFPNKYKNQYIIKVRIIDVSGQFDRYHSVSRLQYRSIHGAILICSVDNKMSVNHLRRKWLKDVREYAPDYIQCMVVCNKSDLLIKGSTYGRAHGELYSNKMEMYRNNLLFASQFAAENSFPIYNISCKSGAYVQQACKDLVDRILLDDVIWKELVKSSVKKAEMMCLTPQYPQNSSKNSCCGLS